MDGNLLSETLRPFIRKKHVPKKKNPIIINNSAQKILERAALQLSEIKLGHTGICIFSALLQYFRRGRLLPRSKWEVTEKNACCRAFPVRADHGGATHQPAHHAPHQPQVPRLGRSVQTRVSRLHGPHVRRQPQSCHRDSERDVVGRQREAVRRPQHVSLFILINFGES